MHAIKKKAPEACQGFEGDVSNPAIRRGNRNMNTVQLRTDARATHLRRRRIAWWTIAVLTALVVVLAASPTVTDVALWLGASLYARVEVVDRRRARRAAHRAVLLEEHAIRQAVALANVAHQPVALEVVA